ncbi:hypothetical protein BDA99DRAFT_530165 [Phascolomyces articulosus]|uniref:C2H2-type domain-containing protein n=1 Tax=Phascolomyces articulosus TaxID=60185 RepID=A0AAD5JWW5_9FUNG|nr:hypothetical protein BDA99DRAFT_530165 [Phascolomyces articulosus]
MFSRIWYRASTAVYGDSTNATFKKDTVNKIQGVHTIEPATDSRMEERSSQKQSDQINPHLEQKRVFVKKKRGRPRKETYENEPKRPKREYFKINTKIKPKPVQQEIQQDVPQQHVPQLTQLQVPHHLPKQEETSLQQQQKGDPPPRQQQNDPPQQQEDSQQTLGPQQQQLQHSLSPPMEEQNIPVSASSSTPSSPPPPPTINQTSNGHSRTFAAPKGELYCPYKGCRSKSTALPHSLYRHIRAKHFANFPKLSPSCLYTFRSPAGELIRFDENSRELLEEGTEILADRTYRSVAETRYHCPYKRCHGRFYYAPSDIRSHLESRHRVVIQSDGDYSKLVFKTTNGQLIRLEDERIGNLFDDQVEIIVSVDTHPNKTKGGTFYCPYKDCNIMCYLYRRDLYRHIRGKHYREFPQLKYHGRNVVFTTDSGVPVNFDESSRNSLEQGTKIVIDYAEDKLAKYNCPYKGCNSRHTTLSSLIRHIRPAHDQNLPIRRQGSREKCVYTGPSGKVIEFDESSRDSLNDGDRLTMTEVPPSPQT